MTALPRRGWWYACFAGAALLLAAAFYLDSSVVTWMADHQQPFIRGFMRNVSQWGDWPSHVVAGIVGVLAAYAFGSRRWIAIVAAALIACAVAGTVNRAIKMATGRSRPSVESAAGWNGPRFSSKYNSFASGHTASSTAFFAALVLARRRAAAVPLLAIPVVIGFSRLYVGAHYLSDVIFAAMLGAFCAALVTARVLQRFLPADVADEDRATYHKA